MTDFPSFSTDTGSARYLQALRRHWLLIAVLVAVAILAALVSVATATKRYTATADLLVRPLSPSDDTYRGFTSLFQQTLDGSSAVVTAARVVSSPEVKAPCAPSLRSTGATVHVQPLGQADVVELQADAETAEAAKAGANAFATCAVTNRTQAFQAELNDRIAQIRARIKAIPADTRSGNYQYAALQQSLATYEASLDAPNPTISLLTEAALPQGPVWPRPKLAIAAALGIALLLGAAIAFFLEFLSPRIGREEELQQLHRLPILTRIPKLPTAAGRGYLSGSAPLPPQAWKAYRVLRAVLANTGADGGYPRSLLVTSAMPGDGKTTTAINLAITLAASDLRVILVDADVHRPMIASFFNVPAHRDGFHELVSGKAEAAQVLVDVPLDPGLKLVLASQQPDGYAGLTAERFAAALEKLTKLCDVVVVDSPPLPEVAEVLELASAVDVVLLSARLGRTRRDRLADVRELLARRGISAAGFVVTTRDRVQRETHYDYPGAAPRRSATIESLAQSRSERRVAAARSRRR